MADIVWPATLPQHPFIGYEEQAQPNTVESEVGNGPPKVRRRSTRERIFQTTSIEITGAQKVTFEAFWRNIRHGSDPFEWKDMATGEVVDFRFVRKPRWRNLSPGTSVNNRLYAGTLELERLT